MQPSHQNIPLKLHALEQHVKRSVYQAGYVWGQCLIAVPEVPSPDLLGWKKSDSISPWTPLWTVLTKASKACQELLKCGCKKTVYTAVNAINPALDALNCAFAPDNVVIHQTTD